MAGSRQVALEAPLELFAAGPRGPGLAGLAGLQAGLPIAASPSIKIAYPL